MSVFQPQQQAVALDVALPEAASQHLPFHLLLYGAPMKVIGKQVLCVASKLVVRVFNFLCRAGTAELSKC